MSKDTSVDIYIHPEAELSTAHFDFNVTHRGGEPCPICGCSIERVTVQNCGSYFCPRCQPIRPWRSK